MAEAPGTSGGNERKRADGLASMLAALPPGWSVVDEDGAISVLDPNGEWAFQYDDPPADFTSDLAAIRDLHSAGIQQGLYAEDPAATDELRRAAILDEGPHSLLRWLQHDDLAPQLRTAYAARLRQHMDWYETRVARDEQLRRRLQVAGAVVAAAIFFLAMSFNGPPDLSTDGWWISWAMAAVPAAFLVLRALWLRTGIARALGYAAAWAIAVLLLVRALYHLSRIMFF